MKTWKTYITIDDLTPKLCIQAVTSGLDYERNFSCLSDLTTEDIDVLVARLQQEKLKLEKLKTAL